MQLENIATNVQQLLDDASGRELRNGVIVRGRTDLYLDGKKLFTLVTPSSLVFGTLRFWDTLGRELPRYIRGCKVECVDQPLDHP